MLFPVYIIPISSQIYVYNYYIYSYIFISNIYLFNTFAAQLFVFEEKMNHFSLKMHQILLLIKNLENVFDLCPQ